jgi:hypothetical protein
VASLLKRAGYVEGKCIRDREIGWNYPRPIVFARPAPRPKHPATLFRAFMDVQLSVRGTLVGCRKPRPGRRRRKHHRSIYRRETAPDEVLARAFYPQPAYEGRDQWIVDPSRLTDQTVASLPLTWARRAAAS